MTVAVLGAAGHLGRKIVAGLVDQGVPVGDIAACVRSPDKAADLGVPVRHGDYDDPDTLAKAFSGADVVVLIPTFAAVEHRVQQHNNAVNAAIGAGVKRLIFAGFAAAQPSSQFLIAPFMLYAESRTRLSGLDWTIIRDGMYLDPIADWAPEILKTGRLPYPVRHGRVAYVSRDDLGRAIAASVTGSGHGGQVYDLSGPAALSMPELAGIVGKVGGRPVRFETVSEDEFAEICRQGGEPETMIPLLNSLYRAVDNGEFETVTDHVERLTGAPPEDAESYLRRRLAQMAA